MAMLACGRRWARQKQMDEGAGEGEGSWASEWAATALPYGPVVLQAGTEMFYGHNQFKTH